LGLSGPPSTASVIQFFTDIYWFRSIGYDDIFLLSWLTRAAGSILFIELSYEPNVQPKTASRWSCYRQSKTPNRQFFSFRAVSRDLGFRHSSSLSFCSHDFSELRDLLTISRSPMSPKSNLRRSPDGRVVGSPKRQTVSFFWFSRVIRAWFLIAGLKRSHRGTEVISSSPALGKKLCLQGTNRAHFRPRCSATKPELIGTV
jgi:hypothetical protein